jgi:hypothetical protein
MTLVLSVIAFHEGRDEALWFTEDLLEFVDHQPGTTIGMVAASFGMNMVNGAR